MIDRSGARYGKEILQENGFGLVDKATPTSVFIVVAGQCILNHKASLDQFGQVQTSLDKSRQIWTS